MSFELKPLSDLWGAHAPSTPFYAYSEDRLETLLNAFLEGLGEARKDIRLHFAMKANNNVHVLNFFRSRGMGLDLVSGGELAQALKLNFAPTDLVLSGVGKSRAEMRQALAANVGLINIESSGELRRWIEVCTETGAKANIAFRVNPNVDAQTHPYISTGLKEHKFGVEFDEAIDLYRQAQESPFLNPIGLSLHIGSQLMNLAPLKEALGLTLSFAEHLKRQGVSLRYLDVGGGLGVSYADDSTLPAFGDYGTLLQQTLVQWKKLQGPDARLASECGRALVAQAGWLVSRVIGKKSAAVKRFMIVDASMTELLRPALYEAVHPVSVLKTRSPDPTKLFAWELVGPVCESADVLASQVFLPNLEEDDLICIGCAGAYGAVMSSQYNGRPLPAEYWIPRNANQAIISKPSVPFLLNPLLLEPKL